MRSKNLILWIVGCSILLGACSKMYFSKPLPTQGETAMELPQFLKGKFVKKQKKADGGGMEFLEIKRFNDQHCKIYTYSALGKDSIVNLVKSLNTDSTKAELKGSTIIYSEKDSLEKMEFVVDGDLYYTPKDTLCEISLSSASFLDDFPNGKAKKLLLKKLGEVYYLNVLEKNVGDTGKDYWFVVKFDFFDSELSITNTSIKDSIFSKRLEHYNEIARIDTLGSSQYLCGAGDEAFLRLFEEPGLFEKVVWEPVAGEQNQVVLYIAGLVVLGVVFVGLLILVVWFFGRRGRITKG